VEVKACAACQSSESFGAKAARAVDGDINVAFSALSCMSTENTGTIQPWWSVDLAVKREVVYVRIYNRRDDMPYWSMLFDNFTIHIGDQGDIRDAICAHHVRAPMWGPRARDGGPSEYVDVACVAAGRFVTVSLPGHARVLSICEVQVMGYAGREPYPTPSVPSTVFSAGGRQWVSLRAQWQSIGQFTERCPQNAPQALVVSWATDGTVDAESLTGLQEHDECSSLSACLLGPPLIGVPVEVSACQRGQLLINYRPTISGRYAFILDVGGSIGRSAPWSISVAADAPHVRMSTATIKDLTLATPGGGQSAVVGSQGSLYVQARDLYGNANKAVCLYQVGGTLTFERLLTSEHLKHGGYSIANLQDSSPQAWPYTQDIILEQLAPINMTSSECLSGRTRLTFTAAVSGIYRIHIYAAIQDAAGGEVSGKVDGKGDEQDGAELQEVRGSGELVEVFPLFQNLSVGSHEPLQMFVAHGRWNYYWLKIPQNAAGFQIRTDRYTQSDGQPWIFIQQGIIPTQARGPFIGVPDAGASAQGCYHCRAHVLLAREVFEQSSSGDGRQTTALGVLNTDWYVGVYGALSSAAFKLSSAVYKETKLLPDKRYTGHFNSAGLWEFFDIDLSSAVSIQTQKKQKGYRAGGSLDDFQIVGFTVVIRITSRYLILVHPYIHTWLTNCICHHAVVLSIYISMHYAYTTYECLPYSHESYPETFRQTVLLQQ